MKERHHHRHREPLFPWQREKPRERFYLLPGMGGRLFHAKQKVFLKWAVLAGIGVSLLFAAVLYWLHRPTGP